MFGSVGPGRMNKPWGLTNVVGYNAAFVRGLRLVATGGGAGRCKLACGGATVRALAGMLLALVGQHETCPGASGGASGKASGGHLPPARLQPGRYARPSLFLYSPCAPPLE